MNYIKDYSYTTANGTKISGFAVDVSKTTANLANLVKVNDTLYPCWNVILVLNQTYPDNVNSLVVVIWAGDGEVSSCTAEPFRYYPSDPNPEPATPTPEATQGVHPGNATTPATAPIDSVKSSITPETTAPAQTIGNPAEAVEIPTSNTFLMVLTAIVAITVIATTITAALIKNETNNPNSPFFDQILYFTNSRHFAPFLILISLIEFQTKGILSLSLLKRKAGGM